LKTRPVLLLLFLFLFTFQVVHAQQRLQVTASFSILADVAKQVAGDAADVNSLMPAGADPHTFSPTPQDLIAVTNTDLMLVNGVNFEEGLMEAIENAGSEMNIVVVSECVQILPIGASIHLDIEATSEIHEAEVSSNETDTSESASRCTAYDEELGITDEQPPSEALGALYMINCGGGEPHEEGEDHDHEPGSCDPHVWTNPENVMLWTLQIRDVLSEADPTNAETYTANAAAYIETLRALDTDELLPLIETLPAENRVLVTNHETLGYFAVHYGFKLIGVVLEGGTTIAEPSTAEVATLIDTIRAAGVHAIFAENTSSNVLIQRVAEDTGVTVVPLYSDSLGDAQSPASTYVDYMRYNVQTIVTALTSSD
jgi:ABC-type Zn uptake system ZnuABC Zn-binding protein ZnuA